MMQQPWKIAWRFLKKLTELPHDQPGVYPREMKTYVHEHVYMNITNSAMIPDSWKGEQMSMDWGLNEQNVSIHIVGLFLVTERDDMR